MGKGVVTKTTKGKEVIQQNGKRRFGVGTMKFALQAALKLEGERGDLRFDTASSVASGMMENIPLEQRAGFPPKLAKGCVHPKDWVTNAGKKIAVDFARLKWLPDEWGQGVKSTNKTNRFSRPGKGGTYTVVIAPDGKVFYHRTVAEKHAGFKFSEELGFNGQIRKARLQAEQVVRLSRAEMKDMAKDVPKGKSIGCDVDTSIFNILTPAEKKHVVSKDTFHFGVVSARRACKPEGVRDILVVQTWCKEAGVEPTWYVDEGSLEDYKRLGLKAVVGGKLTAARNKALKDAKKAGKVCVQLSDDISAWEYRHGPNATDRTDDAVNLANANAQRLIVSPLAAAQFILAKMRGAPEARKPKLGGVYMLGSCARTFGGPAFSRNHFIIGDFFVVDLGSSVLFDESMKLKEDYDFACAHIHAHGSVIRCNRLTLNVKHYSNSGGAVDNRDGKGTEEQRNIGILKSKWPRAIKNHPRRKNEVVLRWPKDGKPNMDDDEDDDVFEPLPAEVKAARTEKRRPAARPKAAASRSKAAVVMKSVGKKH